MERFCGRLLPAVKNRVRPYEHIDNYVQRRAQMQIVSKVHNLPWLSKSYINYRYEDGVEVSSREIIYPEFPDVILGAPIQRNVPFTTQLSRQMTRFFGPFHPGLTRPQIEARIDRDSIVRYGRFRMPGSDRIRTASAIRNNSEEIARDNSFVKFDLLPDANAVFQNRADQPFRQTQYGRLLDIYYVELTKDDGTREPFLLASVTICNTGGLDAALPQNPVVTFDGAQMERASPDIILARTIFAVVGRVRVGANTWAIVDRSRDCARPQFVDEEGNVEFD
ncbi:hypothetical protein FS749_000913 [Ceratobasidium sp. UAMH 11750]|nr:hypothetical protein FS749_000913 [Ceratobasidium sp. UAMH 11750]